MSQPARFSHHGKWVHRGKRARIMFAAAAPAEVSRQIAALRWELAKPLRNLREEAICCVYLGVLRATLRRKLEGRGAAT